MPLPTTEVQRYIGGGRLYWTEEGGTEIEIGGVDSFGFNLTPETVKAMDKTTCMAVTAEETAKSISGSVSFVTKNVNQENMRLALFGVIENESFAVGDELPDGTTATEVLSIPKISAGKNPVITGKIRFVGAGCNGKTPVYLFYKVSLKPNGDISPMSEDYMNIPFSGSILADTTGGEINYFDEYLI